jgi:phosphohistidine swiveling domain-containing protein
MTITDAYDAIRGLDLIQGAVNLDEDLHFSTFYLRPSTLVAAPDPSFAYTTLVAFYQGFTETYFLLREECLRNSQRMREKIQANPAWMEDVLHEIETRTTTLEEVFDGWSEDFSALDVEELLALYRSHNEAQAALYIYARLPEVLDRGEASFTHHLRDLVAAQLPGSSPTEVNRVFLELTAPERPSILELAEREWRSLVEDIQRHVPKAGAVEPPGRLLMHIPVHLQYRLAAYLRRWRYITYHGYGFRQVTTLADLLRRLAGDLSSPAAPPRSNQERLSHISRYAGAVDPEHLPLFRIYSQIGLSKIRRRVAQLKAFYYLDLLLREMALRLDVPEASLRCMLPEEVETAVRKGYIDSEAIAERLRITAYIIHGRHEHVLAGADAERLFQAVHSRVTFNPESAYGRRHIGIPVSLGVARGRARVVHRVDSSTHGTFQPGDILVAEALDPDMLPLIAQAGGIVTAQGGVTSHGAILCRELGKPTISGVADVFLSILDGDEVFLDANVGVVEVVQAGGQGNKRDYRVVVEPAEATQAHGSKAFILSTLTRLRCIVPDFFIIPWDAFEAVLHQENTTKQARRCIEQRAGALGRAPIILRSSGLSEDGPLSSSAGYYPSASSIPADELWTSLEAYARVIRARDSVYRGAIIVQHMVQAEVAGVCFTVDPVTEENTLIIEAAYGDSNSVTSGRRVDVRLVVSKSGGDVLAMQGAAGRLPAELVRNIARTAVDLEHDLGGAQDIEWCVSGTQLFILQARPVTTVQGKTQ